MWLNAWADMVCRFYDYQMNPGTSIIVQNLMPGLELIVPAHELICKYDLY